MRNQKTIPVTPRGQWEFPGERTIVPTNDGRITMKGVPYPVYGVDDTGYGQLMMPGEEYQFPGKVVDETPVMGKGGQYGGLDRWFAEKWVDVKTGKECGRQEGEKRKGYPACRPSKRISEDTPKTASELSSAEKERFKREKTSSERIDYQHRRREFGGEMFDDIEQFKSGGNVPTNPALWSRAKAAAKAKYDVYPSAYANGFAAKWYKQRGGGWKKAEYGGEMQEGGWLDRYQDGGEPVRPSDLPPLSEKAAKHPLNKALYDKANQRQKRLQSEFDVKQAADKELQYAKNANYVDLLVAEFYGPETTYDDLTDAQRLQMDDILSNRRDNLSNLKFVAKDLSGKGIKAGYDPNTNTMYVPPTPVNRGVHSHEFSHVGDQGFYYGMDNPGVGPYFLDQLGKVAYTKDNPEFLNQPSTLKQNKKVGENKEAGFDEAEYLLDPSETKARLRALRDASLEQGYKLQKPGYDVNQYKKGFTPEELKQYEQLKRSGLSDEKINELMYLFATNQSMDIGYAQFGGMMTRDTTATPNWLSKYK